ncbi:hypothetical protein, partial [Escherichia coli]
QGHRALSEHKTLSVSWSHYRSMTSIASYRAGLGYCICKKQTTDLFISGGVLLFSGVINFSFEKLRTCYYLK